MSHVPSLHVRVPASTSNLGPGFDFLGLAIGLFLDATARRGPNRGKGEHRVEYSAAAAPPSWDPSEDLVLRTLGAFEARTGRELDALDVEIHSRIPVGRGFGSSGAAVAAALLLANGLDPDPVGTDTLLQLALQLEGHPDNGTASLLGGCTAAVPTPGEPGGELTVIQPPVHESLHLAVAWPKTPLFTPEARAALPRDVPFADAVENPRRLALLLEGLRTGDPQLLRLGVSDRLHERFRRALIPGADAAIQAAYDAGAMAACLSGAGSGLVAFGAQEVVTAASRAMSCELQGGSGLAVGIFREPPALVLNETGPSRQGT